MTLSELAALVSPKAVKSRRAKRRARITVACRRPQGRVDLGYDLFTDTFRPIPWACEDTGPLTLAQARNVLDHHDLRTDHPAGACAITATALDVVSDLSARRIRETAINAPTVRTKAITAAQLAALVDAPTRPVTVVSATAV